MKEIVLIRLAAGAPSQVDVEQLRDYVIESINKGVLVLGAGAEISTMELPEPIRDVPEFMPPGLLGDADIVFTGESWSSEASEPEESNGGGEPPAAEDHPEVVHTGRGAKEKVRIMGRLRAYRQARGLGSFAPLAEVMGCSDDYIRMIYNGETHGTLAEWRRIEKALDAVEGVPNLGTGKENDNG